MQIKPENIHIDINHVFENEDYNCLDIEICLKIDDIFNAIVEFTAQDAECVGYLVYYKQCDKAFHDLLGGLANTAVYQSDIAISFADFSSYEQYEKLHSILKEFAEYNAVTHQQLLAYCEEFPITPWPKGSPALEDVGEDHTITMSPMEVKVALAGLEALYNLPASSVEEEKAMIRLKKKLETNNN